MASNRSEQPFQQLPEILFSYSLHLNMAAFSASFLITYLTFDEKFSLYLNLFRKQFLYYLILNLIVWISFFWLTRRKSTPALSSFIRKSGLLIPLILFSLLQGVQYMLLKIGKGLSQLDFLIFLVILYLLYTEIRIYIFASDRPAWRHPTTAGVLTQAFTALAAVWGILFYPKAAVQHTLGWILVVTILFRILTMWSRLKFLNRASSLTRQTVQLLLNRFFMLFTVRFVFGLAMPLVYLVWGLEFSPLPFQVVAVMVLVGELSDRILFFVTAPSLRIGNETVETL